MHRLIPAITLGLCAVLLMTRCGAGPKVSAQVPPGGNQILKGHYVFSSIGQFPGNPEMFFETGSFDADGEGHAVLHSHWTQNVAGSNKVKGGPFDSNWTYTLTNFSGTARSTNGDLAFIVCSETGKICHMTSDPKIGWSWEDRMQRE